MAARRQQQVLNAFAGLHVLPATLCKKSLNLRWKLWCRLDAFMDVFYVQWEFAKSTLRESAVYIYISEFVTKTRWESPLILHWGRGGGCAVKSGAHIANNWDSQKYTQKKARSFRFKRGIGKITFAHFILFIFVTILDVRNISMLSAMKQRCLQFVSKFKILLYSTNTTQHYSRSL